MQKITYISEYDILNQSDGVSRKIALQMKAFQKKGFQVEHLRCPDAYPSKAIGKILSQLLFFPAFQNYSALSISSAELMYVRKPIAADRYFIAFLKKAKQNGTKKIVLELPVYPYDGQIFHKWYKAPILLKDIRNRRKLKQFVDLIATYSFDREIFGIPAVHIENALDFSLIKERKTPQKKNRIDLLAVSSMAYWHGYDRIIKGMKEYYSENRNEDVFLHLVGDGPDARKYKKLIEKAKLSDHIFCYGLKSGEELDKIYDLCDIGVCTLGCHRKKMYLTSELKSREYAAKGLPMVGSCDVSCFLESECDFFWKVPADESDIDIEGIVCRYQSLLAKYGSRTNLSKSIRAYGNAHCDIYRSMEPITDFFSE